MINQIFLRYGTPRRMITDNGTQFVSAVTQQLTYALNIDHILLPVYHPQANMVERKNRDLKYRLSIMVGNNHSTWSDHLPAIQFAMNTTLCNSTGFTAAYMTFARELRTMDDVNHDLRTIIEQENFVPQITPALRLLAESLRQAKETNELIQIRNQKYSDKHRRPDPGYTTGQKVLITTHTQSKKDQNFTSKLAPKRDGPYIILQKVGTTRYDIASLKEPEKSIGIFHTSAITPFIENEVLPVEPIIPIRKRGRPPKK